MKSGRYIGVMSGTSLDGVDVVLAAIDENMVAQQASLTWPIPVSLKEDILSICQGQQLTLSQLGQLDVRLGALFAEAVLAKWDGDHAYQDERLTTASARRVLIEADVSREKRKQVIDKVAAVVILQGYLDAHGNT